MSTLNRFKSLINQVYQKGCTIKLNKKKDKNNYFRAEISQRQENLLSLKHKNQSDFIKWGKKIFFLQKSKFFKNKFPKTYMSQENLSTIFDINTLWSYSKCKDLLHTLNAHKTPAKEHMAVDR